MLIRGKTTEERIGEIANKFNQGLKGYAQSQRQEVNDLQQEAAIRQRALQTQAQLEQNKIRTDREDKRFELDRRILEAKEKELTLPFEETREYKKAKAIAEVRAQAKPDQLSYQDKLELKAQKDAEVKAKERQDPAFKLEKLGAEGASKVGAIASGIQAIDQLVKTSGDGYTPQHVDSNTPLLGRFVSDNPYSEAERTVSEVIGRLQSGGAIGTEEIKTFRALGPRPGDDAPTRSRKLGQQRDFLNNKLTAFNMSTDDLGKLGFKITSDYKPRTQTQSINTKQAAPVNEQQVQAIKSMSDEELLRFVQGG